MHKWIKEIKNFKVPSRANALLYLNINVISNFPMTLSSRSPEALTLNKKLRQLKRPTRVISLWESERCRVFIYFLDDNSIISDGLRRTDERIAFGVLAKQIMS